MNEIRTKLLALGIPEDRVRADELMSKHTSFRVGGRADLFVRIAGREELAKVLTLLSGERIPHLLIGNGSNLLFSDNGYRGVCLRLEGEFEEFAREGNTLTAGSAVLLSRASAAAAEQGLAGLEFASGIPGTLGGAVFMNAGAYGGEMKDVVTRVWLMAPDGSREECRENSELGFTYRNSRIQEDGWIVERVELALAPDDPEAIRARMLELQQKRNAKQPVNYPSAGSTFKRPAGGYAAALIEQAGLKGTAVGGAEVSEKHSGFLINKGGATATEVLALMRLVRDRVYEMSGIRLEPEVRIIGETWE